MPFCINCGNEVYADYIFCPKCGFRIDSEGSNLLVNEIGTKKCSKCGAIMPEDLFYCLECGAIFEEKQEDYYSISKYNNTGKWKNKWIALFLCLFLGWIGAHKYYEEKIAMGILYTFTFGLLGFGSMIDFIVLLFKPNPYIAKKPRTKR